MRELRDDFLEHGRDYDDLDKNAMAIDPPRDGWKVFARLLSTRFGGQFWAAKASITWCLGRHVETVIDREIVRHVLPARAAASGLGIEKPGWTPGKIARQAVAYIDSPQKGSGNCEELIEGRHGYYSCEPGQYEDLQMFDVQSCYWQIFSLMPSIRVVFHQGSKRIQFLKMGESEEARFEEVKRAFNSCKKVRNSILGVLLGSDEAAAYYTHGEKKYLRLPPGPNRAAGYVIVRTAWELAQHAAIESNSVLTMVDSICTESFDPPGIWESVGLKIKRAAHGPADIVRPGVYQVGDRVSVDYWLGDRERRAMPHPPAPEYQIGVWL